MINAILRFLADICPMSFHYFACYKPYLMLSQFTPENEQDLTLAHLPFSFPKDCYTVGRLDKDSEGLLLLTNDNLLKTKFLSPNFHHPKTYLAQVEGVPDAEALTHLQNGIDIRIKGKTHRTAPAKVGLTAPPLLPDRDPPVRFRANIPTSWLRIELTEGKNRQVRRMCAAVGFPVLRLVRFGMGNLTLETVGWKGVKVFTKKEIYKKLDML